MDTVVNIVCIIIGAFMLLSSYRLIKNHDLKALYDEKAYQNIPPESREDYAQGMGKALGVLGTCFIAADLLFFVNQTYIFIVAEIILLAGILLGVIMIYRTTRKYEKK